LTMTAVVQREKVAGVKMASTTNEWWVEKSSNRDGWAVVCTPERMIVGVYRETREAAVAWLGSAFAGTWRIAEPIVATFGPGLCAADIGELRRGIDAAMDEAVEWGTDDRDQWRIAAIQRAFDLFVTEGGPTVTITIGPGQMAVSVQVTGA
jgi:hypothetical protein